MAWYHCWQKTSNVRLCKSCIFKSFHPGYDQQRQNGRRCWFLGSITRKRYNFTHLLHILLYPVLHSPLDKNFSFCKILWQLWHIEWRYYCKWAPLFDWRSNYQNWYFSWTDSKNWRSFWRKSRRRLRWFFWFPSTSSKNFNLDHFKYWQFKWEKIFCKRIDCR